MVVAGPTPPPPGRSWRINSAHAKLQEPQTEKDQANVHATLVAVHVVGTALDGLGVLSGTFGRVLLQELIGLVTNPLGQVLEVLSITISRGN